MHKYSAWSPLLLLSFFFFFFLPSFFLSVERTVLFFESYPHSRWINAKFFRIFLSTRLRHNFFLNNNERTRNECFHFAVKNGVLISKWRSSRRFSLTFVLLNLQTTVSEISFRISSYTKLLYGLLTFSIYTIQTQPPIFQYSQHSVSFTSRIQLAKIPFYIKIQMFFCHLTAHAHSCRTR